MLPQKNISYYAGSDVSSSYYPKLKLDPSPSYCLNLKSLWRNSCFFLDREIKRTNDLINRRISWAVLERTWISQVVFNFAITTALQLPKDVLIYSLDRIEREYKDGKLYFPSWLLLFKISPEESFNQVVARDGRYFDDNFLNIFSHEQRNRILQSRVKAYELLNKTEGLPIVSISFRSPMELKIDAATTPPYSAGRLDHNLFFETFRELILNSA